MNKSDEMRDVETEVNNQSKYDDEVIRNAGVIELYVDTLYYLEEAKGMLTNAKSKMKEIHSYSLEYSIQSMINDLDMYIMETDMLKNQYE